jgi:hypothetical protein
MRDKSNRSQPVRAVRTVARLTCAFFLATACVPRTTPQFHAAQPSVSELIRADTLSRPIEIYNDPNSGLGAIRAVITTRAEFDKLWEILRRDKSELPPVVDFSKDMVVVAGMGQQLGAGNGIRITSVRDTTYLLGITVEFANQTAECLKGGYPVIDHPTTMVRVPRSRSTPVFRDIVHRSC